MDKANQKNTFTFILFIIYSVLLIWVILFKLHFSFAEMDRVRVINLIPFLGSGIGANEFYNFIFFIPLGLYICMLKSKWVFIKKVCIILCVSLLFEIFQFVFTIGRSDTTDLLCNTLGGITGIGLYELSYKILKTKANRVLSVVLSVITACVLLFFTLLLTHSLPFIFNL